MSDEVVKSCEDALFRGALLVSGISPIVNVGNPPLIPKSLVKFVPIALQIPAKKVSGRTVNVLLTV